MTTEEIKEFILWAKSEKVASFKLEGIEVEFSPLALVDKTFYPEDEETEEMTPGTDLNEVDDELLYHSS